MTLRAVLFDFDGLILDTETPEVETYRHIYAEFGQEFPDWVWQKMIGYSTPEVYDLPWMTLGDMMDLHINIPTMRERASEMRLKLIEQKPIQPGATELLDQASHLGIRVAVVSSSPRGWVEGHLKRLGLHHRFEFFVCGYEGLPSKPAPDLYLAGLQRLGLPASEVIAIEDSPNGMKSATDAGLRVLCVPNELTKQLDLSLATRSYLSLQDIDLSVW